MKAVSLLGGPNLVDEEDGWVGRRLVDLVALATLLLECLDTALEERITQSFDVLGLNLTLDVEQELFALWLLGVGKLSECEERKGAN